MNISRYNQLLDDAFGAYAETLRDDVQDPPFIHDANTNGATGATSAEVTPPDAADSDVDVTTICVARGDSLLDVGEESRLKSAIPGVSDECWTQFVRALIVAPCDAVSASNHLGMFEMTPRRLADLGMVKKLARSKSSQGRTIWVAIFIQPMTSDKFLKNPDIQYDAFKKSTKDYANKINSGTIEKDPYMSLSGALAILHRAGPSGLDSWKSGNKFESTEKTYEKVAGIF